MYSDRATDTNKYNSYKENYEEAHLEIQFGLYQKIMLKQQQLRYSLITLEVIFLLQIIHIHKLLAIVIRSSFIAAGVRVLSSVCR